jgi:hypothetical protein
MDPSLDSAQAPPTPVGRTGTTSIRIPKGPIPTHEGDAFWDLVRTNHSFGLLGLNRTYDGLLLGMRTEAHKAVPSGAQPHALTSRAALSRAQPHTLNYHRHPCHRELSNHTLALFAGGQEDDGANTQTMVHDRTQRKPLDIGGHVVIYDWSDTEGTAVCKRR